MATSLRRLLPAQPAADIGSSLAPTERPKRTAILVACTSCQRAKTKCSGDRPACHRCGIRNIPCEYDAEPNQTRVSSMRESDEQLRELYTYLHRRPWSEVLEIVRRIRENPDPLAVVRFIRDGDVLIRRNERRGDLDTSADASDLEAGRSSPNQSRPLLTDTWTIVADEGLVQRLVGIFFEREQPFLMSFIDKDMFLTDMQANCELRTEMQFCSPLLVNAICAVAAFHWEADIRSAYATGNDLGRAFFIESKRLLDSESGRPSIPTAQALFIMFSYSCRMGRDRAGHIFRAAGHEMLRRMMPRVKRVVVNASRPYNSRRALSRAIWGIFCFDSICSSAYLRPSLIPVPDVPRPSNLNCDVDRGPIEQGVNSSKRRLCNIEEEEIVLQDMSELSEIFNQVLAHASGHDNHERIHSCKSRLAGFYAELLERQSSLPVEEGYQGRHQREHAYLWAYYHLVAAHITRLLDGSDVQLPGQIDRPTDICVRHCQDIMKHVAQHLIRYPAERRGCLAALYFAYACTITLIGLLRTLSSTVRPFSQACLVIHDATVGYPLSSLLLEGLAVVSKHLGVKLPAETAPYFDNIQQSGMKREAIPLGFVVPVGTRFAVKLAADEWDYGPEEAGVELGDLLARFDASSVC